RPDVAKIFCVGRTPPVEPLKTEFISIDNIKGEVGSPEAAAVICCLGTTMAKAGSKEAFEKVDHELPVNLAKWTRQRASKFILMSSVGADAASKNFYLKTKGQTEIDVRNEFRGPVFVLRPSMLMGPRKEKRLGERIGIVGASIASPFLGGKLAVYKPVKAADVAAAMVQLSLNDGMVLGELHYHDIVKYARRSTF
ncbi:MAG TPA: hypothetical protein VEY71_06815, partial [Chitinophagales bacterium]|nr:hypothetical protein [Chitinophagales bacterium]